MRAVIQRVAEAQVRVNAEIVGAIGRGLWVLLGVAATDSELHAQQLADKIARLRIFPDRHGKMNLSIADINGEVLVVSQFTLYADCRRGNRPSFTDAAPPPHAEQLYRHFCQQLQGKGLKVATGRFGAEMAISSINHGPVTIQLEI